MWLRTGPSGLPGVTVKPGEEIALWVHSLHLHSWRWGLGTKDSPAEYCLTVQESDRSQHSRIPPCHWPGRDLGDKLHREVCARKAACSLGAICPEEMVTSLKARYILCQHHLTLGVEAILRWRLSLWRHLDGQGREVCTGDESKRAATRKRELSEPGPFC